MTRIYGTFRNPPPLRVRLMEEDDTTRYRREGWDPRKTTEENMSGESLFVDDGSLEDPNLDPAPRKPSRQVRQLAAQGRGEDTEVAHVARGELVVPQALQTPEFMAALARAAAAYGVPLERLSVGSARNSINPHTGAPEFALDELTPEMKAHANRVANMPIPIAPPNPLSDYLSTDDLLLPQHSPSQPNWDPHVRPPTQSMRPARQAPNIIDDPNMMPSFKDQAIASLPTDKDAQKRALANAKYPAPYTDQTDRFFEYNGRWVYTDFDGKKYYAEPALQPPTNMQNLDEAVKWAGSMVGPSMTFAGGLAGGTIGEAIAGPAGAYRGATWGAAGADVGRQYLANRLTNEQKSWRDRLLQTGGSSIEEALDIKKILERYGR
jgi:hypothetical protein